MISHRGWLPHALATASVCLLPTLCGADPYPDVAPKAQRRAHALALFYHGATQERLLERGSALAAFEQLLGIDPSNTDVAMRAAKLAAGAGDRTQGRRIIDASLEANPTKFDAYLNLARYLDLFQPAGAELPFAARALQVATLAEENFPDEAKVCNVLIELLLQGRDVKSAADAIRRFAKRKGDVNYWLTIATEANRVFKHDGGDEAITREEVDALYDKALIISRNDPDVADAVANYHIGARAYERALQVLEPVVEAHPELGLEREKLARIYRIQGKTDEALAELRALVNAYPNQARTQRLLSQILAETGDYEGAVRHRSRAVQLGGAETEDYVEIASQLADQFEPPRYTEALGWLERGISTSPVSPRLHYMKGIILGNMERFEAALDSYRRAETTAKVAAPAMLDSGFYYKLGSAADRAGLHDEAREHFDNSVALVPADQPELAAGPLNDHGYMLLILDQEINKGGEMIRRAVELDPDNPVYLDSLGWFYYKKALFKKALVELRRAKQLMGKDVDPEVQQHIDTVRKALGE